MQTGASCKHPCKRLHVLQHVRADGHLGFRQTGALIERAVENAHAAHIAVAHINGFKRSAAVEGVIERRDVMHVRRESDALESSQALTHRHHAVGHAGHIVRHDYRLERGTIAEYSAEIFDARRVAAAHVDVRQCFTAREHIVHVRDL